MSKYDQRHQVVNTQLNADVINIGGEKVSASPAELVERGKFLLKAHLYVAAVKVLEEALRIGPDMADVQYYLAIALLQGQRPKLLRFSTVRAVESYLQAAICRQPSLGRAYLLWAVVKYDYYVLNGMFERSPTHLDLVRKGVQFLTLDEILEVVQYMAPMAGNAVWEWLQENLSGQTK